VSLRLSVKNLNPTPTPTLIGQREFECESKHAHTHSHTHTGFSGALLFLQGSLIKFFSSHSEGQREFEIECDKISPFKP
jgi:hypothetical protein